MKPNASDVSADAPSFFHIGGVGRLARPSAEKAAASIGGRDARGGNSQPSGRFSTAAGAKFAFESPVRSFGVVSMGGDAADKPGMPGRRAPSRTIDHVTRSMALARQRMGETVEVRHHEALQADVGAFRRKTGELGLYADGAVRARSLIPEQPSHVRLSVLADALPFTRADTRAAVEEIRKGAVEGEALDVAAEEEQRLELLKHMVVEHCGPRGTHRGRLPLLQARLAREAERLGPGAVRTRGGIRTTMPNSPAAGRSRHFSAGAKSASFGILGSPNEAGLLFDTTARPLPRDDDSARGRDLADEGARSRASSRSRSPHRSPEGSPPPPEYVVPPPTEPHSVRLGSFRSSRQLKEPQDPYFPRGDGWDARLGTLGGSVTTITGQEGYILPIPPPLAVHRPSRKLAASLARGSGGGALGVGTAGPPVKVPHGARTALERMHTPLSRRKDVDVSQLLRQCGSKSTTLWERVATNPDSRRPSHRASLGPAALDHADSQVPEPPDEAGAARAGISHLARCALQSRSIARRDLSNSTMDLGPRFLAEGGWQHLGLDGRTYSIKNDPAIRARRGTLAQNDDRSNTPNTQKFFQPLRSPMKTTPNKTSRSEFRSTTTLPHHRHTKSTEARNALSDIDAFELANLPTDVRNCRRTQLEYLLRSHPEKAALLNLSTDAQLSAASKPELQDAVYRLGLLGLGGRPATTITHRPGSRAYFSTSNEIRRAHPSIQAPFGRKREDDVDTSSSDEEE